MRGERPPRLERSADAAAERNERLRELGQVSGELLHDLAGLLSVLSSRVSLAREASLLGRVPADELGRIQQDADEIRQMVTELLAELRDAPRSPEVGFAVVPTIEAAVDRWLVAAPALTTTLDADVTRELRIVGPRTFFTRAIGNLLRNAARHARSEIRIGVTEIEDGSSVEIVLEDDGNGVPEAWRQSLFQPFVTGSGDGAGLGLSFARWGLGRLGGRIELEAECGELEGAAFRIRLPLGWQGSEKERRMAPASAIPHPEPGRVQGGEDRFPLRDLRVAVVDDDPAVRDVFCRLLTRAGAESFAVTPDGWESAADAQRDLDRVAPDVILLDVGLGDIPGDEVLRHLKAQGSPLVERVVFLTGGLEPAADSNRPVLNKLDEWSEVASRIRAVADGGVFHEDTPPSTG